MDKITTGFIGLGNQGAPIARRMVDAGFPLHIWARREVSTEPFADTPAVVEASPAELGAACDLVGLCVVNDDDVRDVVLDGGLLAAMKPGSILAIHSTLLPETVIAIDRAARERNVHVLDAPVSGGATGAREGTMTVMVGGDAEPLETARPVFDTFATTIAHLGPIGSGQMIKLLNNNLAYANLVMAINALELADGLGMDRQTVIDVIRESSGYSHGFNILTNATLFHKVTSLGSNLRKDVHHLLEVASARGLDEAGLLAVSNTADARLKAFARTD